MGLHEFGPQVWYGADLRLPGGPIVKNGVRVALDRSINSKEYVLQPVQEGSGAMVPKHMIDQGIHRVILHDCGLNGAKMQVPGNPNIIIQPGQVRRIQVGGFKVEVEGTSDRGMRLNDRPAENPRFDVRYPGRGMVRF